MTIQTIEIILYTESLSSSNLSNTLRTKTKIHSARDTPSVAQIPIEIRIPHKTLVQRVLGVWYQAVEGLENLDGFTVIDFENISRCGAVAKENPPPRRRAASGKETDEKPAPCFVALGFIISTRRNQSFFRISRFWRSAYSIAF